MMHHQRKTALLFRPPLRGVADADGFAPAGPKVDAHAQQHKGRQPVADRFNPGNKRQRGIAQHQRYLKARSFPARPVAIAPDGAGNIQHRKGYHDQGDDIAPLFR